MMPPRDLLDTLLGFLGFAVEIVEQNSPEGTVLQVYCGESHLLTAQDGQVLEDLQYLLNRVIQAEARLENLPHNESTRRITVDVEHYRAMRNDEMIHKIRQMADLVRQTGRPIQLEPMNSYDRRLVHNAFVDDPEIQTVSPRDDARLKSITLKKASSPT